MTLVFLTRTFIANPGYLPSWLKTPLTSNREPPINLVRIYNMRFWTANKIYSFEKFAEPGAATASHDDDNFEISFSTEADTAPENSSSRASMLIREENATSMQAETKGDIELQSLTG